MSWGGLAGQTVRDWPIVISDAPIRCGYCDQRIIGSGEGVVQTLLDAVARHAQLDCGEGDES